MWALIADYQMDDRFRGDALSQVFINSQAKFGGNALIRRSVNRDFLLNFVWLWNVSSVWLESLPVTQVVTSSSLVRSAESYRDGEVGISRVSYARSRVFESHSRYKHIKYVERCHNLWHLFFFVLQYTKFIFGSIIYRFNIFGYGK